jgi:hypothetical protein
MPSPFKEQSHGSRPYAGVEPELAPASWTLRISESAQLFNDFPESVGEPIRREFRLAMPGARRYYLDRTLESLLRKETLGFRDSENEDVNERSMERLH